MAAIEKKYLQAIDNKTTKSITKHVLEATQHLFENYGQVRKTVLNGNEHSVKVSFYTLPEPLSTIFTKIEDLRMLEKAAKKPYSDRQIVEIAMNIISNTNDFEK